MSNRSLDGEHNNKGEAIIPIENMSYFKLENQHQSQCKARAIFTMLLRKTAPYMHKNQGIKNKFKSSRHPPHPFSSYKRSV